MDFEIFDDFCGGQPLLNTTLLYRDIPVFTPCLQDTLPVWVAFGFLWVFSLPFFTYMLANKTSPLPFSYLHIIKTSLCMGLACMAELHFTFRQMFGTTCTGMETPSTAATVAMGIKIASFLLAAALLQVQKRCGVKTTAVTFTFWLLVVTVETLPLYSCLTDQTFCHTQTVFYIYYGLLWAQLVAHCWAEIGTPRDKDEIPCPRDDASILNRFMHHWFTSLIYSVFSKKFSRDKMWKQAEDLQSALVSKALQKNWKIEYAKDSMNTSTFSPYTSGRDISDSSSSWTESTPLLTKQERDETPNIVKDRKASLLRAVLQTYWFGIAEFTFYSLVGISTFFVMPLFLGYLIDFIDIKETSPQPLWLGIFYCIVLFVIIEVASITYHVVIHHTLTLGLRMKSALMFLIFDKAMTVSRSENKISVGEIVNLLSVDCQRIGDSLLFSYYLTNAWVILLLTTVMLWNVAGGLATLVAMLLLLMVVPVCMFIAHLQNKIQKELLDLKGKRVKMMNEVLSGIKVLKMYAWENTFIDRVMKIREKEVRKLRQNAILMAITTAIANQSVYVIHFALILIYVLVRPDHYISSSVVFVSLSVISIAKYPLVMMPTVINSFVQAYVSLTRIQEFLCCSDLDVNNVSFVKNADNSVFAKDGCFSWDNDRDPYLSDVNLKVKTGQLIAVVGHCGSGKSSLMAALLGEMRRLSGCVQIKGSIAYVPQEAWIQNMTLRDNIVFGKEYNSSKYWKTIENCSLKSDLALLDGGDKTEIGEKGTNISGGQKQRISLARAVYSNADVYFLDDPLSAVDAHVGKDLFKNVIGNVGMLKNKTRILVTHAIHWLPLVDNIVVMDNGRISEFGTYDELMTHNGPFAQFLLQYLTNEPNEELDDPEIQWIRNNIMEQVESVTSDGGGGASSDGMTSRIKNKKAKKKKLRRRGVSGLSVSRSISMMNSTTYTPMPNYDVKRLTTEEVVQEGSVKLSVVVDYMKAMGMWSAIASVFVLFLYNGLSVYSMFWLTFWTEDPYLKNVSNSNTEEYGDLTTYYLSWYVVMVVVQGITVYYSYYLSLTKLIKASSVLHSKMLMSVLRSPMSFFDTVPIGRILNRFSSDIDIMDNKLPEGYRVWINMIISTLFAVLVMIIATPVFILVMIPAIVINALIMYLYLPTVRKMRRIESVTRSPIYNHLSETLTGSTVIRSYGVGSRFLTDSTEKIDGNSKYFFAANTGTRWVGIRVEIIGCLIVLASTLMAVTSDTLNGGQLGLSVNYAVQIAFALNTLIWSVAEMEMNVVSAERVSEYTGLIPEADWTKGARKPSHTWPTQGSIEYKTYSTRYRAGLELVLQGISFKINHGEKIGVVGRTGAGKSSLTLSLFRIIEATGGAIFIDGMNIADLGLHTLRSKFTILPQDPVLFSGTLRMNVDPVNKYSDVEIWTAIECAHLKQFTNQQQEGLDYDCGEAGQNLSVGQRQLVCLARTLLNKTKILILDEATAAVDMATDDLIQNTIRTQFSDCTILTIAHRLNTIMDYDRVMVLDKGLIKEFAHPRELLKDKTGIFHSMAKDAGLL